MKKKTLGDVNNFFPASLCAAGPSSYQPIHIRKKQDTGNQAEMEGGLAGWLAEIDALLKEERPFSPKGPLNLTRPTIR